jgi:hypothetical protein
MARRFMWMSFAAVLATASLSQPWSGGAAQAGPGPKPAAAAVCKDVRSQLADAQTEIERLRAENAQLQHQVDTMQMAERTRAKKLADQLGSPMIEKLH